MKYHGNPCWYELATLGGDTEKVQPFYEAALGWTFRSAGMDDHPYTLAMAGSNAVAGLTELQAEDLNKDRPHWRIYFAVDDMDATVTRLRELGGAVLTGPYAVPGTGRIARGSDPQRAEFGLIEPDMTGMSDEDRAKAERVEGAFDQQRAGHGNWNELMSSDAPGAIDFYAALFGWTKGDAMDMQGADCPDAPSGIYQIIRRAGRDIGAIMPLGNAPASTWLPYFGVDGSVTEAIERIRAAGGHIEAGPMEVPGPAFIAVGNDPLGAWFAIVGPQR